MTSSTPLLEEGQPRTGGLTRVLFVDDSASIRTLARYWLSPQRGFTVLAEAADGAEALASLEAFGPDCVVLDIEMPGMGGFEMLAELRVRHPSLPVIMLSGRSDPAAAAQALRCGADSYLEKSDQLLELAETVRRVTAPDATRVPGPVELSLAAGPPAEPSDASGTAADLRRLEYVVSHDLAEPLRIMNGFTRLLESGYGDRLDATGHLFVQQITDAAGRMQTMLDELVAFSRAGRLIAQTEPVDTGAVVASVLRSVSDQVAERGARVTTGTLPAVVGDPDLLQTVLQHLVRNALMFNRSAVPEVHIEGRREGGVAVITVTDNGIGVAAKSRPRVFELFFRLHTREEFPGTGTGLALSRRLLGLQDGTITLDCPDETGTTVTIRLPAHLGPLPGDPPRPSGSV